MICEENCEDRGALCSCLRCPCEGCICAGDEPAEALLSVDPSPMDLLRTLGSLRLSWPF